jgi:uncharacterized protein (DUF1697 family)
VKPARYAVLLRGINVGRAKRVGMADLREALTATGYADVATLLQSGNVVLTADQPAGTVARGVQKVMQERFGLAVEVIVRTRKAVRHVVEHDPFHAVADDGSRYFVGFLAAPPDNGFSTTLSTLDRGDDLYTVDSAELYVWCPHGPLESPFMTALGKVKSGPTMTVRNWNTVQKLAAMLG